MKAKILLLVCAGLVACILFIGARGYGRTTWEYKVPNASWLPEEQLNELGAQGWELAGMTFDGSNTHFYFKRPK